MSSKLYLSTMLYIVLTWVVFGFFLGILSLEGLLSFLLFFFSWLYDYKGFYGVWNRFKSLKYLVTDCYKGIVESCLRLEVETNQVCHFCCG